MNLLRLSLLAFAALALAACEDAEFPQAPSAAVLQAIDELDLPPAPRRLKRLVTEVTTRSEDQTSTTHFEHVLSSGDKVGVYSSNGELLDTEIGRSHFISATFLDRVLLNYEIRTEKGKAQGYTTEVRFDGDWRHMPVGAELTYTQKELARLTAPNRRRPVNYANSYSSRCRVTAEINASELHEALAGVAKRLECEDNNEVFGDSYQHMSTVYFLVDYAYTVELENSRVEENSTSTQHTSTRITEAE